MLTQCKALTCETRQNKKHQKDAVTASLRFRHAVIEFNVITLVFGNEPDRKQGDH